MNILNAVASTERFGVNIPKHYIQINGIMVVYDVTSRESFNNVEKWMNYGVGLCSHKDVSILL